MSECCLLIYMTYIPLQLSQISNLNLCHYFTNHRKKNQPGFPKLYFRFKNIGLDGINQTPNIVNNLWCCWVFSISLFFSLKKHDLVFLVLNFYNFTLLKAQKRSVHTCTHERVSKRAHTHTHLFGAVNGNISWGLFEMPKLASFIC